MEDNKKNLPAQLKAEIKTAIIDIKSGSNPRRALIEKYDLIDLAKLLTYSLISQIHPHLLIKKRGE